MHPVYHHSCNLFKSTIQSVICIQQVTYIFTRTQNKQKSETDAHSPNFITLNDLLLEQMKNTDSQYK